MDDLEKKTIETVDGEKIEVYDAVQVEEAITKKDDGFKEEKETLETTLKEATEKLEKADEKAGDFAETREAKEKAETELKEATEAHDKEKTELTEKLDNTEQKYRKESYIKNLVGDDKELADKVEFHLTNSVKGMPESTVEELEAKLKAAYTLSTGITEEDKLNTVISSAGGNAPKERKEGDASSELRDFGKNFGLEEKDWDVADGAK